MIIGQSLINISRQTQTIKTLKKMDGEKGQKRKGTGRRGPYKKFYVQEETCSSDTLQGDEDMAMFDVTDSGIDATIELDDTQSQCSSETVEIGFSAQVYCTLLIVI